LKEVFLIMCADASREQLEKFQILPLVLDNVQFATRQRTENAPSVWNNSAFPIFLLSGALRIFYSTLTHPPLASWIRNGWGCLTTTPQVPELKKNGKVKDVHSLFTGVRQTDRQTDREIKWTIQNRCYGVTTRVFI